MNKIRIIPTRLKLKGNIYDLEKIKPEDVSLFLDFCRMGGDEIKEKKFLGIFRNPYYSPKITKQLIFARRFFDNKSERIKNE